jgi:hypothetical protein
VFTAQGEVMSNVIETNENIKMTIDERIAVMQEVWESLAAVDDYDPITEVHKTHMDLRLVSHQENPPSRVSLGKNQD